MTLEEAGDQIAQAEEAARAAIEVVARLEQTSEKNAEENRQLKAQVATQATQIQGLQAQSDTQAAEIQALKESSAADRAAINAATEQLRANTESTMATMRQEAALLQTIEDKIAAIKEAIWQQTSAQLQEQRAFIVSNHTELVGKALRLEQAIDDNRAAAKKDTQEEAQSEIQSLKDTTNASIEQLRTYVDTNLQQHATQLQEQQTLIESSQTTAQKNTDELSTASRRELRAQAAQIQALHAKVNTQAAEIRALKAATDTSIEQLRAHVDTDLQQHTTQLQEQQALIKSNQAAAQKKIDESSEAIRKEMRPLLSWSHDDDPALFEWLGGGLSVIYKSSRDGSTYGDLLRCVGDKSGLVFIIRKGTYLFGAFIIAGLQLPDDPTKSRRYVCDVWYFSLAGHFDKPTKIDIDRERHFVYVTGAEAEELVNMAIGTELELGFGGHGSQQPADDIRSCLQYIGSDDVPEGYTGAGDGEGDAYLGGSYEFMADEIEVLWVNVEQ